jgi:divalent anion:Na+ symporter, DASS family
LTNEPPPTAAPDGRGADDVRERLPHARLKPALLVLAIGAGIWFVPPPEGVAPEAWRLFAIFVATVVGIIAQPLPLGAVALIGITATILTGILTVAQALSGFGNPVIWLIVGAFFISRAFIKTGLGRRIAYLFVALYGRSSIGLGYGLIAADLVLAPAIPSNTARAGGVLYPVLLSVAKVYGSEPHGPSARRIGAFLTKTAFQGTIVTSAMFLTAMAGNPLSVQLAGEMGITITWVGWAVAAVVPGALSLALVPLLIYRLYPPEIRHTPAATDLAREELARMGPVRRSEKVLLGVFLLLLVLWIFGRPLGVDVTTAALIGLTVLLVSGVLTWRDVVREEEAWNTLVWFAALVMMATFLNTLGFIPWFSDTVAARTDGLHWIAAFLGLSLVYFYSHYFFASNVAHISAMYAPFLAVAVAAGAPPVLSALVLAFFSNLFSSMTHYGTGPAPIFFGGGYVPLRTWWRLGLLISFVNIAIWLGVGSAWWRLLGLW